MSLDPAHHSLSRKRAWSSRRSQNLATVAFQLNPALHVESVTDGSGKSLSATQKSSEITVTPAGPLTPGSDVEWTFTYSGVFDATHRWRASPGFCWRAGQLPALSRRLVSGNRRRNQRFTAEIHVHVPMGDQVLGSGICADRRTRTPMDRQYSISTGRSPGFPGTVIAGKFQIEQWMSIRLPDSRLSNRARSRACRAMRQHLPRKRLPRPPQSNTVSSLQQFGPTDIGRIEHRGVAERYASRSLCAGDCSDCRQSA